MTKPLELRNFCYLWIADCSYEQESKNVIHVWEPLRTEAPRDASPYCCYGNTVIFYRGSAHPDNELCRTTHSSLGYPDHLLWIQETKRWWSAASGRCCFQDGRWCMKWRCHGNDRLTEFANLGMKTWNESWFWPRWLPRLAHWGSWHGWRHGWIEWNLKHVLEW